MDRNAPSIHLKDHFSKILRTNIENYQSMNEAIFGMWDTFSNFLAPIIPSTRNFPDFDFFLLSGFISHNLLVGNPCLFYCCTILRKQLETALIGLG